MIIRLENENDYLKVENLARNSFWNVYRPGAYEHYIIHNLRKDSCFIEELAYVIEKDGEKLNISGVDSLTVGADDLDKVLEKLPHDGASILLVHEPDFAKISSKTNRFDLQMSGHSHGGQLVIPGVKTTPFRCSYSIKYPVGAYKVNNMIQYTSKGLGTNSFWIRVNCKPEITQFYLKTTKRKNIEIEG